MKINRTENAVRNTGEGLPGAGRQRVQPGGVRGDDGEKRAVRLRAGHCGE